tara:strand:- start:6237 stop:7277 length:1041 start_codon:yes stop_codon:yes gene_type:complete
MVSFIKKLGLKIFLKFVEQEQVSRHIQGIVRQGNFALPNIENEPPPYSAVEISKAGVSDRDDIVFITSRFRSGSTLLWNLFRQSGQCTSYYEPFNERQWFNSSLRGEGVDGSHRGVDDYWAEYDGLANLANFYQEDWIRADLLMTEQSWMPKMKHYIEELVTAAPYRPVLQFNRIDFRLPWIKHHFPKAKLLHLYRNPRDQWCSFLRDPKLMNKDDVQNTYEDSFYLDVWCNDLARHYPVLDSLNTPHPYQRFYYLWKLSFLHGKQFSDLSISFEALTQNPTAQIESMFNLLNITGVDIQKLSAVIQAPEPMRWKKYADENWFKQHEDICEQNLSLMLTKSPQEDK